MTLIAETTKSEQTSSKNGDEVELFSNSENENFTFLKTVKLKQVLFWDVVSNTQKIESTKFRFKQVKLRDLIKQRKGFFTIDDETEYKRCKVQLYAKGVILRDIVKGSDIKTKKQQLCKEDDFLVAEIDAKVGGYGIVPSELENAVVSSHYFLYEIDKTQLLPEFLGLYVKTDEFSTQVKATGSTNYASIRPAQVLEYEVSLPPIKTQKKLVDDYNSKMSQAEESEDKAEKLEKNIETYLLKELGIKIQQTEKKNWQDFTFLQPANLKKLRRWDFDYLSGNQTNISSSLENAKFSSQKLGDIFKFVNRTWNKKKYSEEYFSYIELGAIDKLNGITKVEKVKTSNAPSRATQTVETNDLIIGLTRPNLKRFTMIEKKFDGFICSSGFQVIESEEKYNLEFLLEFLKSEAGIKQFEMFMTGALYPAITSKQLKNVKITLPPLKIQNKIVNHIDSEKVKIKQLKSEAENLRIAAKAEFEAELFEK